jgi:hypothetical protein
MTIDSYSAIKAINWSSLKAIGVSPRLYRHRVSVPEPDKPEFALGRAAHCAILEPDQFSARYAVFDGIRRGKAWDEWRMEHPGVESLKPHDLETALAVAESVSSHRIAGKILRNGRREEAIQWTDSETGFACKGKVDYLRPDFLIDLKTAGDLNAFVKSAINYGYIGQCAWYHDGAVAAKAIQGEERPYVIAVQKTPPYDVAVYQLDVVALEYGRRLYRGLLERLRSCIEADYWPGAAPDLQTLSVPQWAVNQMTLTEEQGDF